MSRLFFLLFVHCQSAQMDQGHDCGVLMLQSVRVSVAQRVVIFDNSVAADFAVAEQAKQRGVGKHLVKGVGLYVGLVVIVVLSSPHTGEHET